MSAPARPEPDFEPKEVGTRLQMQVPGRLDAITPAVERVMDAVREHGCARGKEFEVETALREALSNAVRHGCAGDERKHVVLRLTCDPSGGVLLVLRDPGPGFDPRLVPSPTVGQNVYRHSGRGLYLIRQLMDEVSFARNGTEIRMRKR